MPNPARTLPANLFTLLSTAANAFVALVTFYILKYIFELPFLCLCSPGIFRYDIMYMCGPPFIIFWLVFIIDKHRLFCGGQCQKGKCCDWCSFVGEQFLRLLLSGVFWIAALFIDGDWYECQKANKGSNMVCTNGTLSDEEMKLNTHHRNDSLVIGLLLTLLGLVVWAVWSCSLMNCRCCQPNYHKLYQNYLSAETEAHLTEELKKLARERAQIICKQDLTIIREQERQPMRQEVTVNIEQGSDPAESQLTEKNLKRKEKKESDCCKERQTASWHNISGMFFHQSDITESRDVSLFYRHQQEKIEADLERQIQELANKTAAVITETRFRELKTALQINDPPQSPPDGALQINDPSQSPPDGALPINDPPQSQSDEGAPSTQRGLCTDKPGQEGKASPTDQIEKGEQPGPSS